MVGLKIRWDCRLNFGTCSFQYTAARLDYPERTVSPGFNFRYHANSHCNECMHIMPHVCTYVCTYIDVYAFASMVLQSTCYIYAYVGLLNTGMRTVSSIATCSRHMVYSSECRRSAQ